MDKIAFCQSCAMPLDKEEFCGSNADGSKNKEYCVYCFQEGGFTNPCMSLNEMIDCCSEFLVKEKKMDAAKAKEFMENILPKLKRWQNGKTSCCKSRCCKH